MVLLYQEIVLRWLSCQNCVDHQAEITRLFTITAKVRGGYTQVYSCHNGGSTRTFNSTVVFIKSCLLLFDSSSSTHSYFIRPALELFQQSLGTKSPNSFKLLQSKEFLIRSLLGYFPPPFKIMPSVGSFLNTKINFFLLAVKKELFLNTSSGVNKTQSLKKEPQLFFLS